MQTVLVLFLWLMMPIFPSKGPLSLVHPFHVSVTEITQNAAAGTLEVQVKLFTDDFEAALKKVYDTKVDLIDPALHERMDSVVLRYIYSRLQLRVNEKAVPLQYLGFEQEREATYVYLEAENIQGPVRRLDVYAKLLYEQFSDQVNIFHATAGKAKKSTKLEFPAYTVRLDFE